MIVKEVPPSIYELLHVLSTGSVVTKISGKMLFAAVIALIAAIIQDDRIVGHVNEDDSSYAYSPFSALGIAISLYLGFRNNSAYARWWEARKALGAQLVHVRNLGRTLITMKVELNKRKRILHLIGAHVNAFRTELRLDYDTNKEEIEDIKRFLNDNDIKYLSTQRNIAEALLRMASEEIGDLYHNNFEKKNNGNNNLDSVLLVELNQIIAGLVLVQGICERIAKTPLPYAYNLLVHRSTYLYILLAPFSLAVQMHYYVILFNVIVTYTFFGLDEVTRQLENPFGNAPYCVALSAMSTTCEISIAEALGEVPPPALKIDDHGLLM